MGVDRPLPEGVDWYQLTASETAERLGVDPALGLTRAEAMQRLADIGPNAMTPRSGQPGWLKFILQFHQPLVYLLLAATLVTALLQEWVDSGVIFGVVLINAIIGYLQEAKAEKALEALSRLVKTEACVRREGVKRRIASGDLVPGDLVLLQAGDRVPADLRLIEVRSLHCDESALTGESVPTVKEAGPLKPGVPLADRLNQAYAGTLVTTGQGEGIVCETGDRTETGRIAEMISEATKISTPLTRKIAHFSRLLLWVIVGLAGLTFAVGVMRGESAFEMFMASVALAVGAIPEGLPAAVTIVLAIGVSRMAKRRAIIRRLPAVETLGSTTVICSDKTGTLTENEMTVQAIWAGQFEYEVTGAGYDPVGEIRRNREVIHPVCHPALLECLRAGVLCNDSELLFEEGRHLVVGDPTEAALLVAGAKAGLLHADILAAAPRLDMIPFESGHMFRATLHGGDAVDHVIYQVGALERLLGRCDEMLDAEGIPRPLDADAILTAADTMAARGLRVLAMTRRHLARHQQRLDHSHVAEGLTFLGLQGMLDPPRPDVRAAVTSCRRAGIAVKMITGDHAGTARVIAAKVGLADDETEVGAVTGRELDAIGDEALPRIADETTVFARVAPEQKLRLVRALQASGHVVAMTGDGVNDAPALEQADIGVAMGISGTDVAQGAADMVLTDDHFATIKAAVEEGRAVFDNLSKFIVWTLPTNLGEGGIILAAILFGFTLPVVPVQILWINMTTALLLGLMLVFEPQEPGIMNRPPRHPKRPLLTFPLFMRTGLISLLIVVGGSWIFHHELSAQGDTLDEARTAVANTIVMVELVYLFCCRSLSHSLFSIGFFTNRFAVAGAASMILLQLLFTYAPVMNRLFHTQPLDLMSWVFIVGIALVALIAVEVEKWVRFNGGRKGNAAPD